MVSDTASLSEKFVILERDFIREHLLPDFEYTAFDRATSHTKLSKPLSEAKVALVSTAGLHLKTQEPFKTTSPKGDDSYREIPIKSKPDTWQLSHPGYRTSRAMEDIDVVFPINRLNELAASGTIASVHQTAYSFMGYIPETDRLLTETAPSIAGEMRQAGVDVVLLVPA